MRRNRPWCVLFSIFTGRTIHQYAYKSTSAVHAYFKPFIWHVLMATFPVYAATRSLRSSCFLRLLLRLILSLEGSESAVKATDRHAGFRTRKFPPSRSLRSDVASHAFPTIFNPECAQIPIAQRIILSSDTTPPQLIRQLTLHHRCVRQLLTHHRFTCQMPPYHHSACRRCKRPPPRLSFFVTRCSPPRLHTIHYCEFTVLRHNNNAVSHHLQ